MCAAKDAALKAAGADEPETKPFSFPSWGRDPSQGSSEPSPAHQQLPVTPAQTSCNTSTCSFLLACSPTESSAFINMAK